MLGSLIMSASIPQAFNGRGLAFAAAFTAIMVGSALCAWAAVGSDHHLAGVFERVGIWWATISPL
jgi:low temperature requirement protein LtrA